MRATQARALRGLDLQHCFPHLPAALHLQQQQELEARYPHLHQSLLAEREHRPQLVSAWSAALELVRCLGAALLLERTACVRALLERTACARILLECTDRTQTVSEHC